jgi:hypothetical protein
MDTHIGAFDPETRSVSVTFVHGGATFTRRVNAVVDGAGAYDEAATADRVAAVGLGVAYKFEAGLIPLLLSPETETGTPDAAGN